MSAQEVSSEWPIALVKFQFKHDRSTKTVTQWRQLFFAVLHLKSNCIEISTADCCQDNDQKQMRYSARPTIAEELIASWHGPDSKVLHEGEW